MIERAVCHDGFAPTASGLADIMLRECYPTRSALIQCVCVLTCVCVCVWAASLETAGLWCDKAR